MTATATVKHTADAPAEEFDYDDMDNSCPNCGGEGVIYMCFEEFACIDPEGGCDLCERRCDWCRPRSAKAEGRAS